MTTFSILFSTFRARVPGVCPLLREVGISLEPFATRADRSRNHLLPPLSPGDRRPRRRLHLRDQNQHPSVLASAVLVPRGLGVVAAASVSSGLAGHQRCRGRALRSLRPRQSAAFVRLSPIAPWVGPLLSLSPDAAAPPPPVGVSYPTVNGD
jgi:hypothetical protein